MKRLPSGQQECFSAETRFDWGNALDVRDFYGRETERALLEQWAIQEHCRVVSVLGMGGIGKSALAVTWMHQVASAFQTVVFRSVRDVPPCHDLLADCLRVFSPEVLPIIPTSVERCLDLLLEYFQTRRCLLVLDNLEVLLQTQDQEGHYLSGYEDYATLLRRVAETPHQSCLLLTSREIPVELTHLEDSRAAVRSLPLTGLAQDACEQLFEEQELAGTVHEREQLVELYGGNPLALKIVMETIVDLFGGEIGIFLEQGEMIFSCVRNLLATQWVRLSTLEQFLLTWLAIVREPLALEEVQVLFVFPISILQVKEAMEALQRHSLIEEGKQPGTYTLQSVVLQYVTETLVERVSEQIQREVLEDVISYTLEQIGVKEYVRQTQRRLLVAPIVVRLRAVYQQTDAVEKQLFSLLDQFRAQPDSVQGYGPANVIALLRELRGHLRSVNLSHLSIRGASLQGIEMQNTSLVGASLRDTTFTEAFDAIWKVAISSKGTFWAAGSQRGEVRVWREGGQTLHLVWQAHTDNTYALAFSPDEHTLATGSWDGTVKLWDLEQGALLWTGWHTNSINCIGFSPDGSLLVSSGDEGVVRFWEVTSGKNVQVLDGQGGALYSVAWSPDGQLLATGNFDDHIRVWQVREGQPTTCIREFVGHTNWVMSLAFSPDGSLLASGSWDSTVKLWEIASGQVRQTLTGHTQRVYSVAWSPDGRMVASAGDDPIIWLWDVEHGRYRSALRGHTFTVYSLAFTSDSHSLLSGSEDSTLRVWDVKSGECVRTLQGYAVAFYDIAWSPDSTQLASADSDMLVTIWEMTGKAQSRTLRGHDWSVFGVAWSPDGRLLASSGRDNAIRVWNPVTGVCLHLLRDPDHGDTIFQGIAWSPDGRLLASASYMHGVQVWDMTTYKQRWVGYPLPTKIRRVAWSPDSSRLASCGDDGSVCLWEATDGTLLKRLQGHRGRVASVAWSPDGTRLASGGGGRREGEILVWDRRNEKNVHTLPCQADMVCAVAWSRDSEVLVSGGSDGTLSWWKVQSEECLRTREGHCGAVQALGVSPDGHWLASSGDDGAIRIWDLESGELERILRRDRPYERLNITGAKGLTQAQKATLHALGAVEENTALS